MRLVFCGSGAFAAPTLAALHGQNHEIVRVFTQPDRPSGRGRQVHATPVKDLALELGIPVYQPNTLRDGEAVKMLFRDKPELAVVVAYGHLIPRDMLDIPEHGFINAHASILPKYRGAAPVPHAILAGESETGVTVFRLNEKFDEGDILGIEKITILHDDTSLSVLQKLAPVAAELTCGVVGQYDAGWVAPVPQDDFVATKAPKLQKDMGLIDWVAKAAKIERMIRAFQPWPLAFTHFPGRKRALQVSVLKAEVVPLGGLREMGVDIDLQPGVVMLADGREGIIVRAEDAALRLVEIKPEGKRAMLATDYMRGAKLVSGTALS